MMTEAELLAYRRELAWHVDNHPSERWEAKLQAVNEILSGGAPVKGAGDLKVECASSQSRPHRERVPGKGAMA